MDEFNKNQHSVYRLTYHAVFVVKYRRKAITPEMSSYMEKEARRLLENNGGRLVEFNSDLDHVHLLFETVPQMAPATVICALKTQLSRGVRKNFHDEIRKHLWGKAFWTESYFLCTTGGATIDTLKKYIEEQQTEQHRQKRKYVKSGKYAKKEQ